MRDRLLADPERLHQCLTNLVENALQYSGASSPVLLSAERMKHQVVLRVSDQGPGVPTQERQRIFERFRRGAAASRTGTTGSGIGLAITRLLMELMGGAAQVRDAPGGGADFQLRLPSTSDDGAAAFNRKPTPRMV